MKQLKTKNVQFSRVLEFVRRNGALIGLISLGVTVIAFPYIFGWISLPRIEEFSYSLLPLEISQQIKSSGITSNWYANYGVGIPWPIPHTMSQSPFSSLFGFGHPFQSLGQFIAIHIVIQVISLWFIGREFRFKNSINILFVISIVFASQLEYLVTSDAAAVYFGWLILPAIILTILKITNSKNTRSRIIWTLLLSISISYGISNSHPGVFSTYLLSCAILFLSLNIHLLKNILFGCGGFFLGLILSSEKIYFYLSQWILFPSWINRTQYNYDSGINKSLWSLFIKPISIQFFSFNSLEDFFHAWINENQYTRVLFLGSPIASLVIGYILINFLKQHFSQKRNSIQNKFIQANQLKILIMNFAFVFLFQFIPAKFLSKAVSASWTFRDPGTIYGLLIICIFLNSIAKKLESNKVKPVLFYLHYTSIGLSAIFIIFGPSLINDPTYWKAKRYDTLISNSSMRDVSQAQRLISEALECNEIDCKKYGERVAMSGLVSYLEARGELKDVGLVLNILPFYGYQEVNSVTKGISQDKIHPSQSMFYGMITDDTYQSFGYAAGQNNWLLQNPYLRDLLGIRVIIFTKSEDANLNGMEYIGEIEIRESKETIVVYRNRNAFPRVIQISSKPSIALNTNCNKIFKVLTCLKFKYAIPKFIDDPSVAQSYNDDLLKITIKKSPSRATILVNSAWSKSWNSDVGEIFNYHGLIGIHAPANTETIYLSYRDSYLELFKKLETLSYILVIFALLILFLSDRLNFQKFRRKKFNSIRNL